ncbi:MAG: hypothetical protein KKH34_04690 [Candidatus Omnitrophica bacterium]|nr:hypothetical protein [Candidatus Omnitrophota bacterium]
MRLKICLCLFSFLICLSLFYSDAAADTIKIKDGGTIQGIIVEEGADKVIVELKYGKMTLSHDNIESISKSTKETNDALRKNWEQAKRQAQGAAKKVQPKVPAKTAVKNPSGSATQSAGTTKKYEAPKSKKTTYQHGIGSIRTDNYANRTLQYYYYIPPAILDNKNQTYPALVMIPWLSGRGDEFVSSECRDFAYKNKFVIISPTFIWDEKNWDAEKSYQYPAVWSGNALLRIIDDFKKQHNIRLKKKFYLFGFSAGAQFALRFAFWKPDLCIACAAHASGAPIRPEGKINTKFFVTCGTQDTERIGYVKEFYNLARQRNIDVTYKTYNIDHALSPAQIEDSMKFFAGVR